MKRNAPVLAIVVAAILAAAALSLPVAAHAAGPVLAPAAVFSESFESAPPARLTLDWVIPTPGNPSPAYWGRVTARKYTGSYGLWCAGSIPGTTTNGWTQYSGRYPDYTAGAATFDAPELADYYASTLDYWYVMPSLGSADQNSLNVMWQATNGSPLWQSNAEEPTTSVWLHRSFSMSVPAPLGQVRPINLSRAAGTIRFLFMDDVGNFGENPTNGEGPTIDDLSVTGWKFGPVRNLGIVMTGRYMAHLTWDAPWRSTEGTSTEDRPIAYRVYREVDGSNAWVEVTSDQITGTSFDDHTAALSGTYRYVVQAEDQGTVTGYGEVVLPDDSITQSFAPAAGAPLFTITGLPAGPTKNSVTPAYSTTETAPSVAATLDGALFTMGTVVTTEGTHTLTVRLTGSGGAATEHSAVFVIDKTAPVTSNNAPLGTQLTPIAVTLTSSDSLSGVAHTYFRIDSATKTPTLYTAPLNIGWGDHTIYYYSVDVAGNAETQKSVRVSSRQPTTLSIASSPTTGKYKHSMTEYGYLSPAGKGYVVKLQYQKPGSSKWYYSNRTTIASGSRGKWTFAITPTTKGTYHFKVTYAGSSTKYKSSSNTLSVVVK